MRNVLERYISILLRGLTLLAKFFFVIFLAKYLEPSEVGTYGLVAAAVTYAIFFVGLDFYAYSTREIVSAPASVQSVMVRDHVALGLSVYVLFLPVIAACFAVGFLPQGLAVVFCLLLLFEYLAQELVRLLIALSRPAAASLVLFVRFGSWAMIMALMLNLVPAARNLDIVLAAWVTGSAVSVAIGWVMLLRVPGFALSRAPIDMSWIVKGIRVSIPFLVATIALRAIFYLDKYWIDKYIGADFLGIYVFYFSLAMVIQAVLDAGVFSFLYPGVVAAARAGDNAAFKQRMRRLAQQTVLATFFTCAGIFIGTPFLIMWIGRPEYSVHYDVIFYVTLAISLYCLSMIPHFGLYAYGKDRPIILGHILALGSFVGFVWGFKLLGYFHAVPMALCAAFLLLFIWKLAAYCRLAREPVW